MLSIDTQSFHVIGMKVNHFFCADYGRKQREANLKSIFQNFFFLGKYTSQPTNSRFVKTKNLSETPKFTFTETLITVFFKLQTHHCPVNIQFLDQCVHPEIALKQGKCFNTFGHSFSLYRLPSYFCHFSNSLIIHKPKTKEITAVKEV